MIERTATFLDSLASARDLDGAFEAYRRLAEALGFPETVIGASRVDGSAESVAVWRTTIAADLAGRYFRDDVLAWNPLYVMARLATRPFASHLDLYRDMPMVPWQREFYESDLTQSSALRIALPVVTAPDGLRWRVSVGGDCPLREVDRLLAARSEALWLAGAALVARLGQIEVDGTQPQARLTARERECLLRLASGDRVDRIGERLGISASAVELHLRNARRRLGARTSPEAVAKAIMGGLIDP